MTYKHLFEILAATKMSPEQFGGKLGLSGMTIRRWRDLPPDEELPTMYKDALVRAVRELIAAGRLGTESKIVREAMLNEWLPLETAARGMGLSPEALSTFQTSDDGALDTLTQIGGDKTKRDRVDSSTAQIRGFQKMGQDWAFRISKLLDVIRSKKLTNVDKIVAYGALFYLINPFDFIPDSIPVLGFLDDLFFLSIALTYYLKRYPNVVSRDDKD